MDPIKEAFSKIKEDMISIKEELSFLKNQVKDIIISQTNNPSQTHTPTHQHTHNPSFNSNFTHKIESSIGNEGVPTHTPTHQHTNKQTQNYLENVSNEPLKDPISEFKHANEILTSLDNVKNGIRTKFKNLTPQEMMVFSVLYSLEGQKIGEITHKTIAIQLNLSESSIRDYINKLIKKGIPIKKIRQNNKTILLKISQDLKNVATLDTIIHLREL
ncbi:HTH domain-containing protein [Candidatus Pacearchaeota archaeon]|nr:HTH domain-containing protein [Candidatus Pacearchaeota archaeon]